MRQIPLSRSYKGPEGHFLLFSKLPQELKDQIWEYVAENMPARVVTLDAYQYCGHATRHHSHDGHKCQELIRTICNVPVIMRVCQDSRKVGKKYYDFTFKFHSKLHGGVWINFSKDTLNIADVKGQLQYMEHIHLFMWTDIQAGYVCECDCEFEDPQKTTELLEKKLRYLVIASLQPWNMWEGGEAVDNIARYRALEKITFADLDAQLGANFHWDMGNKLIEAFETSRGKEGLLPVIECGDEGDIKCKMNYPRSKNTPKRGNDPLKE